MDEKYNVFKVDPEHRYNGEQVELGTYFVLRQQDVFAEQALWGYVNALRTGAEIIEMRSVTPDGSTLTSRRLNALADEISQLAQSWHDSNSRKVPD